MSKKKKKKSNYERTPGVIAPTKSLQEKLDALDLESLDLISNVDERFKRLILKFAHYLREEGFSISVDALLKFFQLYPSFDVFQLNEIRLTLKSLMVKDKEQFDQFNDQFDRFFMGTVQRAHQQTLTGEKEKLVAARTQQLKAEQQQKSAELEALSHQLHTQEEHAQAYIKSLRNRELAESEALLQQELERLNALSTKASIKLKKGEAGYLDWIQAYPEDQKKIELLLSQPSLAPVASLLDSLLAQQPETVVPFLKTNPSGFDQLHAGFNDLLLQALIHEVHPSFNNICLNGAKTFAKLKGLVDKSTKTIESQLSALKTQHQEEIQKTEQTVTELQIKTHQLEQQVQTLSQKMDQTAQLIEKEMSKQHRLAFTEGKNSVQTTLTNLDLLTRDVEKMTDDQYEQLTDIIKANATKFRTKISRSMIRFRAKRFNYHRTMKNSLKTFGVPMELFYEKPKIKKTKIVCILDVSGSCVKSSKLLLRFIYELSSVFKGGVKSYVFVKDLQDVSSYFTDYHLNDAIEHALVAVPRTYSDYYYALSQFHQHYLGEVDRNTIVIFLGDARNNQNDPGLPFLQDIQTQAKSVLWLNTEEKEKWNTNDSIIGLYQPHLDQVYEILTTQDLIQFLEGFRLN